MLSQRAAREGPPASSHESRRPVRFEAMEAQDCNTAALSPPMPGSLHPESGVSSETDEWIVPCHSYTGKAEPSHHNSSFTVYFFPEHNLAAYQEFLDGTVHIITAKIAESGGLVSRETSYGGSGRVAVEIAQHVEWRSKDRRDILKVEYEANQILHRNICSATLDRDIYPKLRSTPIWIKAIFALASCIPILKDWLLNRMLSLQLETICYRHNFNIYHGGMPFQLPWLLLSWGHGRPPRWTVDAHVKSVYIFSDIVMVANYWLGRLLLGMKGEYAEYTPTGLMPLSE